MPRGGRRFGRSERPKLSACSPPAPPGALSASERAAWRELAAQVLVARTYNQARYTAFKLMVRAVAAVDAAPRGLKPQSRRLLVESAAKMLARFGLDATSAPQADAVPLPPAPGPLDEFDGPTSAWPATKRRSKQR